MHGNVNLSQSQDKDTQLTSILLVADSSPFLSAVNSLINHHVELQVVGVAHNSQQALEQAGVLSPQVVLLDLDLHNHTSLDTISRLRHISPSIVIIALSILHSQPFYKVAISAGANALVHKLNLNQELIPAIHSATNSMLARRSHDFSNSDT